MATMDRLKFPPTRRVDCANQKSCIMRMMSDGDIATISAALYVSYLSNELGYQGEMGSPCSLDENFVYGNIVAVFAKGIPLVN